jgi:hypothetical protein
MAFAKHILLEVTMTHNRKCATLVVSLIVVVGTVLLPSYAHGQCNAATIEGAYGYRFNVLFAPGVGKTQLNVASFIPGAEAGRILFTPSSSTSPDGAVTGSEQGNIGGIPNAATFTGTYSVNSDCTGTVTRHVPSGSVVEWAFTIVQSGAEIEFVFHNSSTPRVGEGVMKKQ